MSHFGTTMSQQTHFKTCRVPVLPVSSSPLSLEVQVLVVQRPRPISDMAQLHNHLRLQNKVSIYEKQLWKSL